MLQQTGAAWRCEGREGGQRSSKGPGKEAGHSVQREALRCGWRVRRQPEGNERRVAHCQNKNLWMRRRADEGVLLDRFLYSQASTKQSHQLREQKSVRFEGKV